MARSLLREGEGPIRLALAPCCAPRGAGAARMPAWQALLRPAPALDRLARKAGASGDGGRLAPGDDALFDRRPPRGPEPLARPPTRSAS